MAGPFTAAMNGFELSENGRCSIVGPKGKHDAERTHLRHGTERGSVVLGGRRVQIRRPRVRSADDRAEATLSSYTVARATDLLTKHTVAAMLAGLSTRRYDAALEPVGSAAEQRSAGTSRSSVSRRFVAATNARLQALLSRPLDDERWLIVFSDGFGFVGHTLVGALGVTAEGRKLPLAVVEGSTENKTLATRLVANLRNRGLDASRGVMLFVVDGSQALSSAIAAVFGGKAVIAVSSCPHARTATVAPCQRHQPLPTPQNGVACIRRETSSTTYPRRSTTGPGASSTPPGRVTTRMSLRASASSSCLGRSARSCHRRAAGRLDLRTSA